MTSIGSIPSPFDHEKLLRLASADLDDQNLPRKVRGSGNVFVTPSRHLIDYISESLHGLDWYDGHRWDIELLVSKEPVGVHNDRNRYRDHTASRVCDLGLIIPLQWFCKQPYTITYDMVYPEKIIYKKSILQDLDGNKVDLIRNHSMLISQEDFETYFNSMNKWVPQLSGLNIHSVHRWQKDEIILFESDRLHSSSEFVIDNSSYKMSLNGLRYRDEDPK